MAQHVCPWWVGHFLASPFRRFAHNPRKILAPHVRPGMTVLDLGPGMASFTLDLARFAGPAGRVIAVDIQPRMLREVEKRAAKAGLPYTLVEVQAAASFSAWQVLEAAVTATKSLDDKVLIQWLRTHQVDTIQGRLRFNGPSNYGDDLMRVKQVQNGRWVTVYPKEYAAPGATLQVQ